MRFFSASLALFLTACFAGRVSAQVAVVNQKGTRITVDSSKWTLSGSNIINKNAGNVGVGVPVPIYKLDVAGRVRISDSLVAQTIRVLTLIPGSLSDSLLVSDPATGLLKRIAPTQLNRNDSTTASNGLTLTGKDVRLGGALSAATSITTTAANTLAIAGLQGGTTADSIVVANAATGVLKRIAPAQLNRNDSTTASNGLTLTGKDVRLGGALSGPTSVTTTAVNTLAVSGLQSGTTADSLVVADATSGVLRRITPAQLSRSDSTTASNGLTLTGKDVRLGGALSGATSITTTAANTLAVAGLQGGTTADSLVVANAATGVLKRMAPTQLNRNDSTTASNGLTLTGKDVRLGGALSGATSITTTAANTLAVAGLQGGTTADSIVVANAATGVLKRMAPTQLNRNDSTTASNGLTLTGKDVRLGGALSGATSVTTTAANTLALTGLSSGSAADSLVAIDPASGVLKRVTQSLKPVVAKTVTPQTIATTTMTTISGLSFTPQAGKNYRVRVWIIYDAPLLLNGIKLAPSFAGTGNYWYHITVFTAAAASQEMADINGSAGISTSASKGTTGNLAEIEMDLECTTSGLFSFQFGAVTGGTFTIQSNCRLSYEITN